MPSKSAKINHIKMKISVLLKSQLLCFFVLMELMKTKNILPALTSLCFVFASPVLAAPVTLPVDINEGGAMWDDIEDDAGFSISDATFDGDGDAFDGALMVYVDGQVYAPGNSADQSQVSVNSAVVGTAVTGAVQAMDTVNVTSQYLFYTNQLAGSALVRQLVTLQNVGTASKTLRIVLSGNFGSDSDTAARFSFDGNSLVDSDDVWFVSSDDATTPGDPVVGFVNQGPACVVSRPTDAFLVRDNYFSIYTVKIEAGETKRLAAFILLNGTNDGAQTSALNFNTNDLISTAGLFSDLSSDEQSSIVNFGFINCQSGYRNLVLAAVQAAKKLKAGKGGKAAKTAAQEAADFLALYSGELALLGGQTEEGLIKASDASVKAVSAAASAAKRSASNFPQLKSKAIRALNKLINKIVAL